LRSICRQSRSSEQTQSRAGERQQEPRVNAIGGGPSLLS
jgi:hypothetical protein